MTFYYTVHVDGERVVTDVLAARDEAQAMRLVKAAIARTAIAKAWVHLKSPDQPLVEHFFNYQK